MVIAVVMVMAVLNVYSGLGSPATTDLSKNSAADRVMATLLTDSVSPVQVNGVSAGMGTTILSGALVETPRNGNGAVIGIGPLGQLTVGPDSRFTLEFDSTGLIKISPTSGCMFLKTRKGASGEIVSSGREPLKTDAKSDGELRACADGAGFPGAAPAPAFPPTTPNGWGNLGLAIFGGAVTTAVIVTATTRGNNTSPFQ